MEFKQRPLIRNATPPHKLFSEAELKTIKASVERQIAVDRWGSTKTKVKEEERKAVAELLELARFHGYFPNGIKADGKIRWAVMCDSYLPELSAFSVVTTIVACENCSTNFHAYHYPNDQPPILCGKCGKSTAKITPFHLKTVPEVPKVSNAIYNPKRDARVAELRKQAVEIAKQDEIPF